MMIDSICRKNKSDRIEFLSIFIFIGLIMKVVGEFVHEVMGHGFFILLFKGEITNVHLSLLWPYQLSSIRYASPPSGFQPWQKTWIDGGGILICLVVSCVLQTLLLLRTTRGWPLFSTVFWLSFWTSLNPTGYLIIGGVRPFGDVRNLMEGGVLTQQSSLAIGMLIFFTAFLSLSKLLKDLLLSHGMATNFKELRISISLFWLVIPLTTIMALIGLRFLGPCLFYLPISFVPCTLVWIIPLDGQP